MRASCVAIWSSIICPPSFCWYWRLLTPSSNRFLAWVPHPVSIIFTTCVIIILSIWTRKVASTLIGGLQASNILRYIFFGGMELSSTAFLIIGIPIAGVVSGTCWMDRGHINLGYPSTERWDHHLKLEIHFLRVRSVNLWIRKNLLMQGCGCCDLRCYWIRPLSGCSGARWCLNRSSDVLSCGWRCFSSLVLTSPCYWHGCCLRPTDSVKCCCKKILFIYC